MICAMLLPFDYWQFQGVKIRDFIANMAAGFQPPIVCQFLMALVIVIAIVLLGSKAIYREVAKAKEREYNDSL